MTYYESYIACGLPEKAKAKAVQDAKVAMFLGNNPDRLRAIEDALNKAISDMHIDEMEGEQP